MGFQKGNKYGQLTRGILRPIGEKHWAWKGIFTGYEAKHHWIQKHWGRPQKCEKCGMDKIPKNFKYYFEWANISGEYLRDRSDWKRLCIKCHRQIDKAGVGENNGHAKIKVSDVVLIRRLLVNSYMTQKRIGQIFSLSQPQISSIKTHKSWILR